MESGPQFTTKSHMNCISSNLPMLYHVEPLIVNAQVKLELISETNGSE